MVKSGSFSFVVTISLSCQFAHPRLRCLDSQQGFPWSRAVSSAGLTPSWEGWLWLRPRVTHHSLQWRAWAFHPRDLASDTPEGSLTSPNRTMPAFWWSFQASGVLTLRLCGLSLHHHSFPAGKPPDQSVHQLQTELAASPGGGEPSTSTQAASCTWAELQSLLYLGLQIYLYSHACLYFLKVCQAGAHRYSPVPLTHPSGLLGMVLSCHFQGLERGGE